MSAEWCDFNDMPAATCAHCIGVKELDEVDPLDFVRLSNAVESRYPGICLHCGEHFAAEDQIQRVREVGTDNEGWAIYGHV